MIWGIYEGFKELKQSNLIDDIPKMLAVEPFQTISKVLEGQPYTSIFDGTTELTSINGQTVTFQAIQAVKESNGTAIVVSDQEAQVAQKLASRRGIHLELSSAAAIAAAKKIDSSLNEEKGTIMAIATSSNFLPV